MDKERDKSDLRSIKYSSMKEMGLKDPDTRLKTLSNRGEAVEMDYNTPLRRYYRGGVEMMRMATVYMKEGNYEEAYVLYHKFMTLFLEKVRKHPEYNTVPITERAMNQEMLREVLPKAELLKVKLLERYRAETLRYLADAKEREKAELERHEKEEKRRLKEEEDRRNKLAALTAANAAKAAWSVSALGISEAEMSKPSAPPLFATIAAEFDPLSIAPTAEKKTPSIDRSTKPAPLHHDKQTLRDVIVPSRMMRDFLLLAFKNTTDNKETCGVLAGRLELNKLLVTHLLIPQQTGSPDSCATHNEEDIFGYQDQHNLITLGWIHTHPTQTAFLSSVDLHTHCAYQLMMSEAIAIVCAPKYDETGFFMLTPEYGLNFIANCRQNGFHPHPTDPQLYTRAMHCKLSPTAEVELVDLRRK